MKVPVFTLSTLMTSEGEKDFIVSRTCDEPKASSEAPFKSKISDFWQNKYRKDLGKNWNLFYKRNETRFFRDRHWIPREFPELLAGPIRMFEVGCGVGNFTFPLKELNPELEVVGCDISPRAVQLFQEHEAFKASPQDYQVFVADITKDDLGDRISGKLVDVATCIFVLSALPPESLPAAIANISGAIRPGGSFFIRDYASEDAAQHRFDPSYSQLDSRLFVRQDGTLAHYFDAEELKEELQRSGGFDVIEEKIINGKTTNMKKGIDLERRFIQFKLIKRF